MASRFNVLTRLARPSALARHSLPAPVIYHRLLKSQQQHIRCASSDTSNPFQTMPSPPRLPPDQQAEFERLQRTANTQQGFNPISTPDFTSPPSSSNIAMTSTPSVEDERTAATPATKDEMASVPLRKGAPPEFEGDINPKTGEVGGPKNEPLRWGAAGDYSFNGRVTDF